MGGRGRQTGLKLVKEMLGSGRSGFFKWSKAGEAGRPLVPERIMKRHEPEKAGAGLSRRGRVSLGCLSAGLCAGAPVEDGDGVVAVAGHGDEQVAPRVEAQRRHLPMPYRGATELSWSPAQHSSAPTPAPHRTRRRQR